jgi:hypothetical protein
MEATSVQFVPKASTGKSEKKKPEPAGGDTVLIIGTLNHTKFAVPGLENIKILVNNKAALLFMDTGNVQRELGHIVSVPFYFKTHKKIIVNPIHRFLVLWGEEVRGAYVPQAMPSPLLSDYPLREFKILIPEKETGKPHVRRLSLRVVVEERTWLRKLWFILPLIFLLLGAAFQGWLQKQKRNKKG